MGIEFFQTAMGQRFYNMTMPRIADAMEKIAGHLDIITKRMQRDEEERQRYHMDKFGVDESKNDEQQEKKAAAGCPKCGAKVERHGNTLVCPNCGTEPFEGEKKT